MNVADSQRLTRSLENLGLRRQSQPDGADLILLNTCVVRQSAEDKALGRLNSLKPLKEANPELILALMGCLVGVQGNPALQKRYPWVDVFCEPSNPQPLLDFLEQRLQAREAGNWRAQIDAVLDEEFGVSSPLDAHGVSENLPIVLGCSHACAYCVIPNRRGRERSRDPAKVIAEAKQIVANGARELVLLGQIVDRYGQDIPGSMHLEGLLETLSEIPELKRIRFLTSHPSYMTDALIEAVARLPKVMPHIEVPMQAGDNAVLTAMRRGYTNAEYSALVAKLRRVIPGVSIATDIIVGFPGEDEAAFQKTYELLEELRLDSVHLARYSPRPNTYSALLLPDDVPAKEKIHRFRVLEELQEKILSELNAAYLGQVVPVLFEGKIKARWRGRTPTNRIVFVESETALLGQELPVQITWTGPWSLLGQLA